VSLEIGEIKVEATGFKVPESDRFVARVHLNKGADGLRFAYGPTVEIAAQNLKRKICNHCDSGVIRYGPGREIECSHCKEGNIV
jgi:hypothetical protein